MIPKLLYISGTFFPATGGAELSAYAILNALQNDFQIAVLTGTRYPRQTETDDEKPLKIYRTNHEDRRRACENIIASFRPNVILTQLLWSDLAMELGEKNRIPTVVRVCKVPFGLAYLRRSPPKGVIAVSDFVAKYLLREFGVRSVVIPPLLNLDEVRAVDASRYDGPYITTFNPVRQKGGDFFCKIARNLPEKEFAWVPGWDVLRVEGSFDKERCKAICESLSIPFTGGIPEDADFSGLKNVRQLDCAFPPRPIYKYSRLILIPSRWPEAFGRVAIEAMANRIPVLGSDVGGLGGLLHAGGIALPKDDLDAWIQMIRRLENRVFYEEIAEKGAAFLQTSYNPDQIHANTIRALRDAYL